MKHPLKVEIDTLKMLDNPTVPKSWRESTKSLVFDRYYNDCVIYVVNRYDTYKRVTHDTGLVLDALAPFLTPEDKVLLKDIYDQYYEEIKVF
jgi:hypothetical protein